MAEIRPIIFSIILIGLIAISLINFSIYLAVNNNSNNSLVDDPAIEQFNNNLSSSLNSYSDDSESAYNSVSNSSITLTSSLPFVDAIGGVWKTMVRGPKNIWQFMTNLVSQKILDPTTFYVIVGAITSLLLITILLAVWKLISTGEGG